MKRCFSANIAYLLLMMSIMITSCKGSKSDPDRGGTQSSTSTGTTATEEKEPIVDQPVVPIPDPVPELPVVITPYKFSEGNGTLASPYAVKTVDDLKHIKDKPNAFYSLENDLRLEGISMPSIGTMSQPFSGTFYGRNKTISYYSAKATDGSTASLFGVVSGTIVGLKLSNVKVESNGFASGLVGSLINSGFISSCSVYGSITSALGGNGYNVGTGNGLAVTVAGTASIYASTMGATFNGNKTLHHVNFGPNSKVSQAEYICNTNYVIWVSQCCYPKGGLNTCY